MNKKLLTVFVGIFAISLVAAIGYYAVFSVSFNVNPAIVLSEECDDNLGNVYSGDVIEGSECTITNDAPSERQITISNDASEGISVIYSGSLFLDKKNTETWEPLGESIEVSYTMVGDEFEVTGVPEGYTAIYYKDTVVGLNGRLANPQPAISIEGIGNLPEIDDANMDELANYCAEPDNYQQCKGAKLWLVPNEDLSEGTLNWANMVNYYYELDLIQYNAEGQITLYPGASLTVTPTYMIGAGDTGEQTITTTVA